MDYSSVEAFIKEGYVLVGTDYQGLGGGGRHQYAVAASQARDVIDSIRAVSSMKASGAGKKAIVYGWSQGGGATIAARKLAGLHRPAEARHRTVFSFWDLSPWHRSTRPCWLQKRPRTNPVRKS